MGNDISEKLKAQKQPEIKKYRLEWEKERYRIEEREHEIEQREHEKEIKENATKEFLKALYRKYGKGWFYDK